jgi:hypothetical protein
MSRQVDGETSARRVELVTRALVVADGGRLGVRASALGGYALAPVIIEIPALAERAAVDRRECLALDGV